MILQRRRRLKTKTLRELTAPSSLEEVLKGLKEIGEIEWYEIGHFRTTIKLTKTAGLDKLIKEISKPVVNPRPYVANKNNDPKFAWKRSKN